MRYMRLQEYSRTYLFKLLITYMAVLLAMMTGLWLAIPPYFSSPVWPGYAAAIGFSILYGKRVFPAILLSVLSAYLLYDYNIVSLILPPIKAGLIMSIISILIIYSKYFIFKSFIIKEGMLNDGNSIIKLIIFLFGFFLVVTITAIFIYRQVINMQSLMIRHLIITWLGSDLLGSLIFIPLIISFTSSYHNPKEPIVDKSLIIIMVALTITIFSAIYASPIIYQFLCILLIPLSIWASFKYKPRKAYIVLTIVTAVIAASALRFISANVGFGYFYSLYVIEVILITNSIVYLIANTHSNQYNEKEEFLLSQLSGLLMKNMEGNQLLVNTIEEQVEIRNELRESEDRYRNLAMHTLEGIVLHKDEKIIDVNPAFSEMSGYDRETLISSKLSKLFQFEEYKTYVLNNPGNAESHEVTLLGNNGQQLAVKIQTRKSEFNGEPVKVIVMRDIHRRVNAEKDLNLLKTAIENSQGSLLITKPDGEIEFVNPAFSKITGFSFEEAVGKKPSILKSGYHADSFYKNMYESINQGKEWKGQFRNKKKDGSLYWEDATITPVIQGERVTHFVCTKEDVTSEKNTLEALIASEKQFRTLAENAPVIIAKINSEGQIAYINHPFTDIKKKDSIGSFIFEHFDEKYIELLKKNLSYAFIQRKNSRFEITLEPADNAIQYFDVLIAPLIENNEVTTAILILQDITERFKSKEAIIESERKYRLLAENIADIIWVADSNFNYTYFSSSIEQITGYTQNEIISKPFSEYLISIPRKMTYLLQKQKKCNEQLFDPDSKWETQVRKKDNSVIWLESKIQPIFNDRGEFDGLIGVSRDITLRKNSLLALKESEEKFRSFFENTTAIILLIDPVTGHIDSANNSASEYYGYSIEEFQSITFFDLNIKPAETIKEDLENLLNGSIKVLSVRNKLKNGRIKDVEVYSTPVRISEMTVLFTIVQDVTRRKKAIAALKESESKKLALLKIIPDLIYVINREGILLDIYTDRPSKLYLPPEKLLGKKYVGMFSGDLREKYSRIIDLVFSTHEIQSFEYSFTKNSVTVFEEARLIVSGENELLIIVRDISELKQNEKELKRAWEEAEKANTAKSSFLANISHEIRTPINAIVGFTELLDNELQDTSHKNYLKSIKSSSKTLLSLIEDLLDFSKIEAGALSLRKEIVSLSSLAQEIEHIFWLKMKQKKLNFSLSISDEVPDYLYLDEMRLRQILINLISNAFKFTDTGEIKVRIFIDNKQRKNKKLHIDLGISVSDTGIGIHDDFQQQIFEAFKQQDEQDSRKYGGTGLGLAITRRLVEMMNGNISLISKLGEGSIFTLILKNVEVSRSLPAIDREKDAQSIRFYNAKILVVDDVFTNRVLMREMIKGEDIIIYEAADGDEAIKLVNIHQPDVVLLDLNMPRVSGFTVAEHIRKNIRKKIVIIAISATRLSEKEKAMEVLFDVFLSKPIKRKELVTNLSRFIPYKESPMLKSSIGNKIGEDVKFKLNSSQMKTIRKEIITLNDEYTEIKQTSSFSEIKDFALKISNLGERYKITTLGKLGKRITDSAENFDLDEISGYLEDIPAIINSIEFELEKNERE